MKQILSLLIFFTAFFQAVSYIAAAEQYVDLGKFTKGKISQMILQSSKYSASGAKINFISSHFIDVPYKPFSLIGDYKSKEVLTIDLAGVDCFTYLDYVDALRLSSDYSEFMDNVTRVRYKGKKVSYESRKHFFSDWPAYDPSRVKDVTKLVGGRSAVSAAKSLNKKGDARYLNGIPVTARKVTYIPSDKLTRSVTSKLMTGDYVGIYSNEAGLDVSHAGILIKKGSKVYLRHASSKKKSQRVVDEELSGYLKNKPGIVVYRPL